MGLVLIELRRGVKMVPVYDLSMDKLCDYVEGSRRQVPYCALKQEVKDWLEANGLPDDPLGDYYSWWEVWEDMTVSFFFADPKLAMLFKLTWC